MLPTTPPSTFAAGDTVVFTQAARATDLGLASPAGGWSLTWMLRRTDGADGIDATTTDDGTQWTVTLTAAQSAALLPGEYRSLIRVRQASTIFTAQTGTCVVTPDLSLAGEDVRTWEERTLAIVEGALNGTLEAGLKMYMIGGRQVMAMTPDELMRLRDRLRAVVDTQRTGTFGVPIRFDVVGLR